jgi:hypothetical protein
MPPNHYKVPQNALYAPQFEVILDIGALYVELNGDYMVVDGISMEKGVFANSKMIQSARMISL